MVEEGDDEVLVNDYSADDWLSQVRELVPRAVAVAGEVKVFSGRWRTIIPKLELIPSRVLDLSSHPFFSKNTLCKEQLQAISETLREAIRLGELCLREKFEGKLRMQSDLDTLLGRLDLNLKDCGLLIKTGVLGEAGLPRNTPTGSSDHCILRELLARLQIGNLEAKHRALESLVEAMEDDEKTVLSLLGRSNVSSLIQLLTATSPCIQEKAMIVICSLAELGNCEEWLVSEGVLPPLTRLIESGSAVGREKAAISLRRLSISNETSLAIVGHGGARPLIDLCRANDSLLQAASACTIKNISAVDETRQILCDEGVIQVMIDILDHGISPRSKEYAAECLQNLTAGNENIQKRVVSEGGLPSLLAYLDWHPPQEAAVGAVRNLAAAVPPENLTALGLLPRLLRALTHGSVGAQQAAAAAICRVSCTVEMKKLVGESGFISLLVKLLEAKSNSLREVSAQALSSLIALSQNRRELKKNAKSVPNLVQLLDWSPQNTAKKYAVSCLVSISSSKNCRKLMVSHGATGYLKKLTEMEVPGSKKLLERLERGKLRSLFSGN